MKTIIYIIYGIWKKENDYAGRVKSWVELSTFLAMF